MVGLADTLTLGLNEFAPGYLGKREYGNPTIVPGIPGQFPSIENCTTVVWGIEYCKLTFFYDALGGTDSEISVLFDKPKGKFYFSGGIHHGTIETDDPQRAVLYVKARLDNIPDDRRQILLTHAITRKQDKMSLETALMEVKRFSDENPAFGPTEEEITGYIQHFSKSDGKLFQLKWE
ncbi:hypothetical protein HYV80_04305 [Candidatus Woesearchaeota archaeon]|nr:hypothetical protein [Candidatus Woesearchaeota archaeon]